jgi:LysM repeat protein
MDGLGSGRMSKEYTVKKGDTLSRIAAAFSVSKHDLAGVNNIQNQNLIRVGQVLQIPNEVVEFVALNPAPVDLSCLFSMQFLDAANKPIAAMEVSVCVAGEVEKLKTDNGGRVPIINAKRNDVVKVEVKKATGDWKAVSEVRLAEPATHARIISPKVSIPATMKVHEGPTQTKKTDKPVPQPVGAVTEVRSVNGNPVQKLSLECPNPENLRLGANAKYRDVIIAAGKRSGFTPQSIAAIMNAEAAPLTHITYVPVIDRKTKTPVLGKDGKVKTKKLTESTGEWDPNSASTKSSARGMTQFLDASWVDMAFHDGTFLNERAKKEGWITTIKSSVLRKKQTVEIETQAFKLADGTLVTKSKKRSLVQILSSKPYITARATASDTNLQKLLELRFLAEYAINTAVDYGLQNLQGLKDDDFKLEGLSDGDKAKLIYLTHHLGLSDAKKFIRNTITSDTAKILLTAQVGSDRAAEYAADNGNDYVKGHRNWLLNFIDEKINIAEKMCDTSKAALVRTLLDVTVAIK